MINDKHEKLTKEEQEVLEVKAQIDSLQYEITAVDNINDRLNSENRVVEESVSAIKHESDEIIKGI